MKNGDLVRIIMIDTHIWDSSLTNPAGVLRKGEIAVVVCHNPNIGSTQILTNSGLGWTSDALVKCVL